MTIAISIEADRLFPEVGRVFGTALYSNEELEFLDEHLGQSPGVAFYEGEPAGVLRDTVSPALQRVADLVELADKGTPGLFASEVLLASVRMAARAHLGMGAERTARKEMNPDGKNPWPTTHGYDKRGRDLGPQSAGSDWGRVRATDVALLPIESFTVVENYATKYLEMMEDPLSSVKLSSVELQDKIIARQTAEYGQAVEEMSVEEKLAAEQEDSPQELIQGPNFFECPICQERRTFDVGHEGEVMKKSYTSARNKIVNHLKTEKKEAAAHRELYRLEMKVQ